MKEYTFEFIRHNRLGERGRRFENGKAIAVGTFKKTFPSLSAAAKFLSDNCALYGRLYVANLNSLSKEEASILYNKIDSLVKHK